MSAAAAPGFDRATAVAPVGAGAYEAVCDHGWRAARGPNGGYLAIVLRAMVAVVGGPAREPRSLTCHDLRPPRNGRVRVDVAAARAGRAVSTLTAQLSRDGRDCILAVAAFAIDVPAPAALGPGEPVLAVLRSTTAAEGFFEEDDELWSRDRVLLAQSRRLALLAPLDRAAA